MGGLTGLDQYILSGLMQELPGYKLFFYLLTQLGSPLTLAFIGLLAFIFGKGKLKAFGAVLVIGMLIAIPVIDNIKDIVQRPRPEGAGNYLLTFKNSFSFPSGHAASIFLAATVLGAYFGWRYYAAGYVMAVAVSLSRLYLGVHFPSDISAGAVIGILLGELLVYAAYRMGVCDNLGLVSFLYKPNTKVKSSLNLFSAENIAKTGALTITAIAIAIFFYYLDYPALTLFFIVLAPLPVLYIMLKKGSSTKTLTFFILSSATTALAYSLLFLGAYAMSLLALAIACITMIALTYKNIKSKAQTA